MEETENKNWTRLFWLGLALNAAVSLVAFFLSYAHYNVEAPPLEHLKVAGITSVVVGFGTFMFFPGSGGPLSGAPRPFNAGLILPFAVAAIVLIVVMIGRVLLHAGPGFGRFLQDVLAWLPF